MIAIFAVAPEKPTEPPPMASTASVAAILSAKAQGDGAQYTALLRQLLALRAEVAALRDAVAALARAPP